jgi:hypothetical protein
MSTCHKCTHKHHPFLCAPPHPPPIHAQAFSCYVHLAVIRLFVESILRYGLPPQFQAAVVKPLPKMDARLRAVLLASFGTGALRGLWVWARQPGHDAVRWQRLCMCVRVVWHGCLGTSELVVTVDVGARVGRRCVESRFESKVGITSLIHLRQRVFTTACVLCQPVLPLPPLPCHVAACRCSLLEG